MRYGNAFSRQLYGIVGLRLYLITLIVLDRGQRGYGATYIDDIIEAAERRALVSCAAMEGFCV